MEQFFKENATQPTAWNIGRGYHVSFSVSTEIYKRDEVKIRKLVTQYGLKVGKTPGFVTFYQ